MKKWQLSRNLNEAKAIMTPTEIMFHAAETEIKVILRPEDAWLYKKEQGDQCDYGDMSKRKVAS